MTIKATDAEGVSTPAAEGVQENTASGSWWALEAVADRYLERLGGKQVDDA